MSLDLDERLRRFGDLLEAAAPAVTPDEAIPVQLTARARHRWMVPVVGAAACAAAIVTFSVVRQSGSEQSPILAMAPSAAWFAVVAPANEGDQATYSECMSDSGFDIDAIGSPPIGQVPPGSVWADIGFERAFRRCIVAAGLGQFEGDSPNEVAAKNAKAIGITECMRSAGWEMSDPTSHPVAGYLIPGTPTVSSDDAEAQRQLEDLRVCGAPFDVTVEPNG